MNRPLATAAIVSGLFAAGFAVWVGYSAVPALSGRPWLREAWDTQGYWTTGIPLLALLHFGVGSLSSGTSVVLAPVWTIAGQGLAMIVLMPLGAGATMAPLAAVLVGAPLYAVLVAAAKLGRMVGAPLLAWLTRLR